MHIRVASSADAADIAAIFSPVVSNTAISFELEPPTVDEMRRRIASTLERLPWLVSEDAHGRVNGYAYASNHRDPPAYQWSANTSVYIREDARGQGVGRLLYERLFAQLAALGYFQTFAGIALPNDASVALHRAVGFAPIGVYRNVGYKLGAWRDVAWWQRQLRAPADPIEPAVFRPDAPPSS